MFDYSGNDAAMTIRRATPADAMALVRLAHLDSASGLEGDVIVAEVNGELWAARSLADGRILRDPFRATGEAAALLELRGAFLTGDGAGRGLRARLRLPRRTSLPV